MSSRIKTRTNSRKARDPVRIICHEPNTPFDFSAGRVEGYDEMMRKRELQRYAARRFCVTRKVRTKKGRNAPYPVRMPRRGGRVSFETNQRYPLKEILAAKAARRNLRPQTKAAHWK